MARKKRLVRVALVSIAMALISTMGAGAATIRHTTTGPVYGGTVSIGYTGSFVTFDPAQAFTEDWFTLMGTLYNGLYQSDRTGTPQLDLAAAPPTISPDRKIWTFHLRRGVLFHNGMELTASDVKFSITRTLDPHLKPAVSWGQSTDDIFVGSHAFVLGKTKDVPGIQVLDRYTIRFVLTQPVAILPAILAESFNMVLPRAVVTRESQQYFASHPIGTGPFMLQSWQKGVEAVLVRNPHYFHAGKPYLDRVIAYINVPSNLIALRIEKGELDGFGQSLEITPADLQQASSDPKYSHYLIHGLVSSAIWLDVDPHLSPMTTLAMRQAVAMAIDRTRLVQLLGGNALPAAQVYMPVYPQFDPALAQRPVYSYNPQKAAALVKASGYQGKPFTVPFYSDNPNEVNIAPGVQQDLRQIGLNVMMRGIVSASILSIGDHPITFNVWNIVYADANDIYQGDFACSINAPGGYGFARYCDPVADKLVNDAAGLPLGPARDALMRQAQLRMLRSATHIPLVFPKTVEIASPQVGGFYYQPEFGWQFENYWIK